MKIPRMANAMEHIDDDLISGAAESTKATKNNTRLRWGILAACFTIVLSAAFVFVPMMLDDNNPDVPPFPDQTNAISDDLIKFSELGRNYNSKTLISESYAIAFPENYLLPYEKYSAVKYSGNEYDKGIFYTLDGKYQEMYVFESEGYTVIQVGSPDELPKFIAYK